MNRPFSPDIQILFFDRVNPSDLLWICMRRKRFRSLQQVRYFEPMDSITRRWLAVLQRARIVRAEFCQNAYHIGQVRDDTGASRYHQIYRDVLTICARIRKEQIERHPLIREMGVIWDHEKITFHFEKLAELHVPGQIYMEILRICLVEWIVRSTPEWTFDSCILVIQKKKWFSYLKRYAETKGIHLIGRRYRNWRKAVGSVKKNVHRVVKIVENLSKPRSAGGTVSPRPPHGVQPESESNGNRMLAIGYTGGKIFFDSAERSEFFWLNNTRIHYGDILLYNYALNSPLDKELLHQLNNRNIKLFGHGSGATVWTPTWLSYKILSRVVMKIAGNTFKYFLQGQWISPYFIFELMSLGRDYAYWYDFYSTQKVAVNVSIINATTVGQVLALEALNGISVAWQHSASNVYPTTFISAGENIQFVFSDKFKELWDEVDAPVEQYIQTGFIFDTAVQAVRHSNRIKEKREQLIKKGAQFIMCFFDENSIDRWDMPVPHELAAEDYEFLLQWLLEDHTLGVIFKPKRSHNLFERILRISDLIERASNTGRCLFLMSDTTLGSIYPAEAAFMLDLCIGKLSGTTASFEAHLTGVPTILIDTERFDWHPFYEWGEGQIIFDNWETLRQRVEAYRLNPKGIPELGDWSLGRQYLDPFWDGQATQRMGAYIQWLFNATAEGQPKNVAMKIAAKKYADLWGKEHISCVA